MDVKRVVARLVRKHETNDPFALCRILDISIRYSDLGSIRGIYQYKFRKRLIHININLPDVIKRQVCAHELGHAILHRKTNAVFLDSHTYLLTDRIETEANRFAAELLIADNALEPELLEGYVLSQIAATLEVSEQLLEYKIKY
ncbi:MULTISPECIES: ImmA/IrrE family metallo-endopeptidase [unclassified Dehalobacter]|uniref:ImmA/IrrE family metallo-endopeptidase n=1 Tax=unclassified Dehalobacter TaxID=2635733 RepID=UPI00104AD06D|nr:MULTISPECIES: ImmA/IrrE family metallo-endopeptidase [unclassified Dehalobacter]TCX51981.1 ImmA/IrrE family metallo-endopeptidase [Dehalobacter sp. 14DCB1]TCX53041.1 ImmA/IrrE family metallo-endopeptidase [Dehalobacter sp. 12DCB1]